MPFRRIQLSGGSGVFDVYDTSGPQVIYTHICYIAYLIYTNYALKDAYESNVNWVESNGERAQLPSLVQINIPHYSTTATPSVEILRQPWDLTRQFPQLI